jgi:transposase InsO family protein
VSLVCLDIVRRQHPEWVAVSVRQAAQDEHVSPERVARLATRVLPALQEQLDKATCIGRPATASSPALAAKNDLALTVAPLAIATSLLSLWAAKGKIGRSLILGAYLRLRNEHPTITQQRFCRALGLSPRTLRSWLERPELRETPAAPPAKPPAATKPPRPRSPRRPRFDFSQVLPDTQIAADTTNIDVLGIRLKLMASQDVGDRHQHLLDAVIVEDKESAESIADALEASLSERPGAQVITDQGKPYLAELIDETIERLEAEHAPIQEATPTENATMERGFGTVKKLSEPLFALSNRLAERKPPLRDRALARKVAILILTVVLKSYQAGARANARAHAARQGLTIEELAQAAKEHRELARAELRSKALFISWLRDAYELDLPLHKLKRLLSGIPLSVIQSAERAFRAQVHRGDIEKRGAYFFAIARNHHEEHLRREARDKAARAERQRLEQLEREAAGRRQTWHTQPESQLRDALRALAAQWLPVRAELLYDGVGPGRAWLREAIDRLCELHGKDAACDIAEGVYLTFVSAEAPRLGELGLAAIRPLLDQALPQRHPSPTQSACTQAFARAIMPNSGSNRRSPPASPLLTYPASHGGS